MFLNLQIGNKNKFVNIWLQNVFGIGKANARKICLHFNFNLFLRVESLSTGDLYDLRKYIEANFTLDSMIKREKFLNIAHLKKQKTYKGLRHYEGLPVRGQRTHNNAQTQKKTRFRKKFN